MSSMLGGTMRAPLTGTIFAVELTGNLNGLPALFCGTVAAYAVTVLLMKRSILTEKIARRGQHITREYATDPYELTRAGEIMVTDVQTMSAKMTIAAVIDRFRSVENRHLGYPIVDLENRLFGIVTRADALAWRFEGIDDPETLGARVSDAAMLVAHPSDVVGYVADLMIAEDKGLIPVVDPATRHLRGIVTRKDLLAIRRAAGMVERDRVRYLRRQLAIEP